SGVRGCSTPRRVDVRHPVRRLDLRRDQDRRTSATARERHRSHEWVGPADLLYVLTPMMSTFRNGARRTERKSVGVRWLLALVLSLISMPARGAEPDVAVVVHPAVAVDNLTTAELRRVVLGDPPF